MKKHFFKKTKKADSNCIFFVHIPKTAGTSFRIAAENYFGASKISMDYGEKSSSTSDCVRTHIYNNSDLFAFKQDLKKRGVKLLTGHVLAKKYNPVFAPLEIATFMRNPLEQVISHYEHFVRHMNYEGTLEEFIEDRRFSNLQSRMIGAIPLGLYGFVGITEKYNESIDLLNVYFNVDFQKLSLNTKLQSEDSKPIFKTIDELDTATRDLIIQHNSEDIAKYQNLLKLNKIREEIVRKGLPYTFGYKEVKNRRTVTGVAYQNNKKLPVTIEIQRNEKVIAEVSASRYRFFLQKHNFPRSACAWFEYDLESPLEDGEKIRCYVKNTGQELITVD